MSTLQNRLYNHEVNPPANAWEKIASALDDSLLQNEFPSKLYNTAINPPASAWEKITSVLDESLLQNEFPSRLYNTAINPPAFAWDKINAGLDREHFQTEFSSRLYNMEIAPPASAWDKVAGSLNETTEAVTKPVRKLSPVLRYAAAAIFIGAVSYGVIRFAVNPGKQENATALATSREDISTGNKNKPSDSEIIQTPDIIHQEEDDNALEKSKTLIAKLDRPVRKSRAITLSLMTKNNDDVIAETNLSQSVYAYADHIPSMADRYVMLMTPDGTIIRMSKKWSDLLCCVSGEEQDEDCKDQLKKWQQKIATSSLAPSPGNFMDILGLVNSLNDGSDL